MSKVKFLKNKIKHAVVGGVAIASMTAGQAMAALSADNKTAIEAEWTAGGTDIAYIGGGFFLLLLAVVTWAYLRRTAK